MIYAIRAALTTVVMVSFALPAKAHLPAPKVHNHAETFCHIGTRTKRIRYKTRLLSLKPRCFPPFQSFTVTSLSLGSARERIPMKCWQFT